MTTLQKLQELRNKLAQNPELGVGILDELDKIIKEVGRMYTADDINHIQDAQTRTIDMLNKKIFN